MTERFVDVDEKPIPPQSAWAEMSVNQLIDAKIQLQDKAWAFAKTPQILTVLNRSIAMLDRLISERSRV